MVKAKPKSSSNSPRRIKPASNPEAREQQLIAMAVDCAEQQMLDGTASSQVITHFLKLGTTKAQLELERERKEMKLIEAKIEAMESTKRVEELYAEALTAMKTYSGQGRPEDG